MKKNKIMLIIFTVIALLLQVTYVSAIDLSGYDSVLRNVARTGSEYGMSGWIDSDNTVLKIKGEEIDPNDTGSYDYNEDVEYFMVWKVPNSEKNMLGSNLVYELPETVRFKNDSGSLKNGSTIVGTWTIQDNKLTIIYNDEFLSNLPNNIVGTLHLYGNLGKDEPESSAGENITISFPGDKDYDVHVNKKITAPDLNIEKFESNHDQDNTINDREFKIKISAVGKDFNNVVITDTMGDALSLNGDIKLYDSNDNEITNVPFTTETLSDGFKVTIPTVPANTDYYLKYNVSIDETKLNTGTKVSQYRYSSDGNSIKISSDDLDQEKELSPIYIVAEKYKISKGYQFNQSESTAEYTIKINDGLPSNLSGATVKDILGPNQEYVDDSLKVYIDGVETTLPGLTFEALTGTGYTFPDGITGVVEIKYTVDIAEEAEGTYIDNNTTITKDDIENESSTRFYDPKTLDVTKNSIGYDDDTRTVKWRTIIYIDPAICTPELEEQNIACVRDYGLSFLSFNDTYDASKLDYVDGSFKVMHNGVEYTNYYATNESDKPSVSHESYGAVTAIFGTVMPSATGENYVEYGQYIVEYETKLKDNETIGEHTYINNVAVRYSNYTTNASGTFEITIPDNIISKSTPDVTWDYDAKHSEEIEFTITIGRINSELNELIISDILPEDTTLKDGSVVIYKTSNEWFTYPLDVRVDSDRKISFVFNDSNNSFEDLYGAGEGQLIDLLKEESYTIKYTVIADKSLYGKQNFLNQAYAIMDKVEQPTVRATAEREFPDAITKSSEYDSNTTPVINYSITINPRGGDLNPNGDIIEVEDKMGSAIDFVRGSLMVNDTKVTDYAYDDASHLLSFEIPDETAVTITYRGYINLAVGSTLNSSNAENTIKLIGTNLINNTDSNVINSTVYESNGTTTGIGNQITIYKYKNENKNDGLGGITFKLYEANTLNNNGVVTVDTNNPLGEEKDEVTTATTGDIGYARVYGLSADKVYALVEQPSEGYTTTSQ